MNFTVKTTIQYIYSDKCLVNPDRVVVSCFLHCCDSTIFLNISCNNLRFCEKRFIRLKGIGKWSKVS